MTQEDKNLLLRDLCARSPYEVKIHLNTPEHGELIGTLDAVYPTEERVIIDNLNKAIARINVRCGGFKLEENNVKPYLRPMSSMTEEERKNLRAYCRTQEGIIYDIGVSGAINSLAIIDWLNAHHFDYRGLIEKGLALEAPKDMYNENSN